MKFEAEDVFLEGSTVGPRDWGEELLIYTCPGRYTFKRLLLKKGRKGGLQYHRKKDECAFVVSGELLIRYDLMGGDGLQERLVKAGEWIRFPPGLVHQEEAVTDVIIIEVSSPFFNDRVRVESKYGLPFDGGLETTDIEQIEER